MGEFMNYLKKTGFSILISLGIIIVFSFLNTLLNYFELYSYNVYSIIEFIIVLFASIISGFINGKKSNKNGWFEGLKLIFNVKTIIFYVIVIVSTVIGSMFGIQKKG